jgi:sigma-B regulation protein RsbU (phosphoserine phosphatase)
MMNQFSTRVKRDFVHLNKSRILVVDDSPINLIVIETYLKEAGFLHIKTATDGQQAVNQIRDFNPDLLIIDLMMPVMNGFEVIQHVRLIDEFAYLPIIVQTSLSEPAEQEQAWKNGANDIVIKPIHPLELISRVTSQLKTHHLMNELEAYHATATEDINRALDLQLSLLPTQRMVDHIREQSQYHIHHLFKPCRFLSGDLWGVIDIEPDIFGIWLCDFAGKGIRAAMNTFRLHTIINECKEERTHPDAFLYQINNRLKQFMQPGNFATFIYGVVDGVKKEFRYSSASYTLPILYNRTTHTLQTGPSKGIPLGILNDASYDLHVLPLDDDSSIVLYSDVLWDSDEVASVSFDEDALPDTFSHLANHQLIFDRISQSVTIDDSYADDLTLIEIHKC